MPIQTRKYGQPPFNVAIIHGGPGAAGEMGPVARELSSEWGIVEPFQTKATLEGQIEELRSILDIEGALPINLIGFSWGAWLTFILAAWYPAMVKKLILIGSGAFDDKYSAQILDTRLSRLDDEDRIEINSLTDQLNAPSSEDKSPAFRRFGELISKADAYDPEPNEQEIIEWRFDIFKNVWGNAAELRRSGELLELGRKIECPVIAIHGDYDPHPAEGVQKPLSATLRSFRFFLLEKCGHMPWIERHAKEKFFEILKGELR